MSNNTAKMNMIKQQIRTWGINDQRILHAFYELPRDQFVPERYKDSAYGDFTIPLDFNECMLKPMVEAKILELLNIQNNETVLEIGTGSGYFTALLAKLATSVVSIDIHNSFITQAKYKLKSLGVFNVKLITGDAINNFEDQSNYDVIVITGSMPEVPKSFCDKLTIGGRLFVIVGQNKAPIMEATIVTRVSETELQTQKVFETVAPALHSVEQPEQFTF
ncbi:protein-L-isoaspartate O-methyltransferase [Thiotrichales bacterium 19S3-7]|nr:protein-L-isoaspartate O-methyltransferase [Thiotrichales bacterium 19S3-7]MCF6802337.1 protein-L-isoaspartate O-methyltransferase [Thiotrichales bacterium 19S3-11]